MHRQTCGCGLAERATAEEHDLLRTSSDRLEKALRWGRTNVNADAAAWADETGLPYEVSRETFPVRGFTPALIDAGHAVDVYFHEGVVSAHGDAVAEFCCPYNV